MREVKFRAWSEYSNKLVVWEHMKVDDTLGSVLNGDDEKIHIMQYTGSKDKNGREIYEGDILDSESEGYPFVKNWVGVVKFIDGSFLLENLYGTDGDWLFNESVEREIIGNIYENPELLVGENL